MTEHAEFLEVKKHRDYNPFSESRKERFERYDLEIKHYHIQISRTEKLKEFVLILGNILASFSLIALIIFFKSIKNKIRIFFNQPVKEFDENIFYNLHRIGMLFFIVGSAIYIIEPYRSILDPYYLQGNVIESIALNCYFITAFSWLFAIIGLQLTWDKIDNRAKKMKFQWILFFSYIMLFILSFILTFNLDALSY